MVMAPSPSPNDRMIRLFWDSRRKVWLVQGFVHRDVAVLPRPLEIDWSGSLSSHEMRIICRSVQSAIESLLPF